ncbi:MAG TPA: ABC transporter permease subunit [Tepidisphaeraceae bacterium]|nr:ABC transporter permease subunit [Tepidisphaeraceae bacterium]
MLGIGNYLWRLIPANPILLRVVTSGGKRKRDLFIRCAYVGILLFLVIFLLLGSAGSLANASLSDLSKQSAEIFWWMSHVQLALVALLAPVFTAGAITQEKDSQTYDILLSTPLTNGQIVLGTLLSRLFFVVALLISGLPIFSITQVFGGVAIRSITLSILIACATAFATGALAMAIAVFKVGTRRTIFSFYLWIMLYLAIPLVLDRMGFGHYDWQRDSQGKVTSYISYFAGLHPFLALRMIFGDPAYRPPEPAMVQQYGRLWSWYLSSPHTFYITFMTVLSFVLVTPSIIMLRRLAQSSNTLRSRMLQLLRLSRNDRTRKPRRVWANPIAWREAKTKASATRAVAMRYGFMVLGVAAAVVLLVLSCTRQKASTYIGGQGYDRTQGTVVIVGETKASVYRVRLRRDPRTGTEPTIITLGNDRVAADELREGRVVESFTPDPRGQYLAAVTISNPKTILSDKLSRQFLLGAVMVELAIILLILTQTAASTVTREKEDGTLDLLLTTPITSHYYIWGKLRGLVSFVLPLVAVPIISILLFVAHDLFARPFVPGTARPWTVFPEAIFVLPATLVMVSAFAAILGMQMSLRCRRTVMAVMSSVGIVFGICGAMWVCGTGAAASTDFGVPGLVIGSFSPFTLMALLINPADIAIKAFSDPAANVANQRFLIFFFGWIAAVVYGLVVWAMYKSMVRNFDMTIRRQST